MISGGAITSYNGEFGFMGLFIVRPEFCGRGFGNRLWHTRRQHLLDRLKPSASVGMDGVFDMQSYYSKGGFVFSHRNMRFRAGIPQRPEASPDEEKHIVALTDVPVEQVLEYDRTCFPAMRPSFLKGWSWQPDALALGFQRDGKLSGYGVVRRCTRVWQGSPRALRSFSMPPENNPAAMAFVARHWMIEVFGCARMYLGQPPVVTQKRIFSVTTLDLG